MHGLKRLAGVAALGGAFALAAAPVAGVARPAYAGEEKKEPFGSLSVDEVDKLVQKGEITPIDNNSQERWAKGHVPGAKWVDYQHVTAADLPADKDRALVFYCASER